MRGIGKGQTIYLYVIPEIERLIARELKEAQIYDRGLYLHSHLLFFISTVFAFGQLRFSFIFFYFRFSF